MGLREWAPVAANFYDGSLKILVSTMFDLFSRIEEANRNSKEYKHDSSDTSLRGREAEHEVCNFLAPRLSQTGWEMVNGVRVPDPTTRRRRELDFVITSPSEALVLEMKNWTGEVGMVETGDVVQINRKGNRINAGKLFDDVAERAELLRLHHLSKGRKPVRCRHFVVFYDPRGNLTLDEKIAERDDVLRFEQLSDLMPNGKEPFLLRLLEALMRFFGFEHKAGMAPVPSAEIVEFRHSLSELGGWDVVILNGGLTLCGDILRVGEKRPEYGESATFDRAQMTQVRFNVDRNVLASVFRAPSSHARATAVGQNGVVSTWQVPTDEEILFHRAGDAVPTRYEVRNFLSIQFGYRAKPKTVYSYDDLDVGMSFVGRVTSNNEKGVFVDIGYREAAGNVRHARARPNRDAALSVGRRVLARITRLIADGKLVSVEIVDPQMA